VSSGPPFSAHLVGAGLARLLRTPWVAEFRDPWARAPWREDRFQFERSTWSFFERMVVNRADAAVFVTHANKADFAEHYGEPPARRFHVVPNGCDLSDFEGLTRRPQPDRFVLLHAGSLYGARSPLPLFRAISRAIAAGRLDRDRFRIRLLGRVSIPGVDFLGEVRALGLDDVVEFVPHVSRRAALQEMLDASALLVIQPVTRVSVPAKLYEYLSTGRPILALAAADGETATIVRQSPAGVVVSPSDEGAIMDAISELFAAGAPGAATDPAVFDGMRRAAELTRILQSVAAGHIGKPSSERAVVAQP
jgi:glycosyltransferase involved in cell wall biosynthesis